MNELKPCPFCGGEAELSTRKARNGVTHYRYRCSKCHASIGRWHGGVSGHPWTALEAWNTRAERTCRIVEYADAPIPVCSECGAVQPDDFTVYYCWNCGAKAVGE